MTSRIPPPGSGISVARLAVCLSLPDPFGVQFGRTSATSAPLRCSQCHRTHGTVSSLISTSLRAIWLDGGCQCISRNIPRSMDEAAKERRYVALMFDTLSQFPCIVSRWARGEKPTRPSNRVHKRTRHPVATYMCLCKQISEVRSIAHSDTVLINMADQLVGNLKWTSCGKFADGPS